MNNAINLIRHVEDRLSSYFYAAPEVQFDLIKQLHDRVKSFISEEAKQVQDEKNETEVDRNVCEQMLIEKDTDLSKTERRIYLLESLARKFRGRSDKYKQVSDKYRQVLEWAKEHLEKQKPSAQSGEYEVIVGIRMSLECRDENCMGHIGPYCMPKPKVENKTNPGLLLELAQCLHDISGMCEMIHEMQEPLHNIAERHPEDKEDIQAIMNLCDSIEPTQDQLMDTKYKLEEAAGLKNKKEK